MKKEKLLKQLRKHAKYVREVEYECDYASGIAFAVGVIEKGEFPHWVETGEYDE